MMNFNSIPSRGAMGQQNVKSPFAPAQPSMLNAESQLVNEITGAGIVGQIMPRPQAPISPKAFSNQQTINGVFGEAIPGTYNRNVNNGPLMQMTSQGYIPPVDPTNASIQPDINAVTTAQTGVPLMPPTGVQQQITPTYDLSNQ